MARIDDIFNDLFDELMDAFSAQKELFASAFGKPNAQEITAKAEDNRKKLEDWRELLQEIRKEMVTSEMFADGNGKQKRERSTSTSQPVTTTTSSAKRPVSITVLGIQKNVRYWKDIPVFVCQLMYEKHPHRFTGIENEPAIQGRSALYITTDGESLRNAKRIAGSSYFIETNMSQDKCVRFTYALLEHFGYSSADISIEESSERAVAKPKQGKLNTASNADVHSIKIGVRAKTAFTQLLNEEILSDEELLSLCTEEYSKSVLGLSLPVLKQIPYGIDIDSMRRDKNVETRYYKSIIQSRGKSYILCSQWFPRQYARLEKYLEKYGI